MATTHTALPYSRVLAIADWRADAGAVTAAVTGRVAEAPAVFRLVVPARLHGLDWIGDPTASCPCAQAQVEALEALWADAGVPLVGSQVGDPDPVAAAADALDEWAADEVMLLTRSNNGAAIHPFELARRIEHATGLPTRRVAIGAVRRHGERFGWIRKGGRHCATELGRPAVGT